MWRLIRASFENQLNGSADSETDGAKPQIRACLLAGSDLLDTMKTPGGLLEHSVALEPNPLTLCSMEQS